MSSAQIGGLIMLALAAYLIWWQWLYVHVPVPDTEPPIPYRPVFNSRIARLLSGRKQPVKGKNFACCLPHPSKREALIPVERDFIEQDALGHEGGGHGYQLATMGPVPYLATYVWHRFVLRRTWAKHMMERDAQVRALRVFGQYPERLPEQT